ncbi:MAG: hypothetical protein RR764_04305 [Oscillospiraceae bacterium]
MKRMLKFEMKRLFGRKELYIAILIGSVLSVWLALQSAMLLQTQAQLLADAPVEDAAYFFLPSVFNKFIGIDHAALPTTILFALFPILAVFPYATTYAEDITSGYIKNVIVRTSKKTYYLAKFIVTIFSGFFVLCAVFAVSIFFTTMLLPQIMPQVTAFTFPAASNYALWSNIYRTTPYLYLLLYSFLDAVFYGFFATIALGLSSFIKRRFVIIIIPTVLFFASTYFFGYLNSWAWMPELFLRQYQPTFVKLWIILTEMFIIAAAGTLTFFFVGEKKNVL